MQPLLQYGGVGSGTFGELLLALVVLVGAPLAVVAAGRVIEKLF